MTTTIRIVWTAWVCLCWHVCVSVCVCARECLWNYILIWLLCMTLETVKCVCYTCAETCLKSFAMCAVLLLLRAGSATATAASSIASTMLGITIIALALNNNKWHDRCKCMNKQQCKSEIHSIILCKCWQVMTGNGKWNAIWHGMARYGVLWHVYIIHFERVLGVECVDALNMRFKMH